MTRVELQEGESFDSLLKRFRKKVMQGRILATVKKKRYYVSDSAKRQMARRKAVRRERKRQQRERRATWRA